MAMRLPLAFTHTYTPELFPRQPAVSRPSPRKSFDVFINHRGVDTKNGVAKLLHHHLSVQGLHAFLDKESMKPGDKLSDTINHAIRDCELGLAIFSPRYCDSYWSLKELAMLLEFKKRLIPIFCDIQPCQLDIKNEGIFPESETEKFKSALKEARNIVGLKFNTSDCDWLDFLTISTDGVLRNLEEPNGIKLAYSSI